eukprot:7984018-Prorocentrum_lima.AAC.1
MIYRQTNQHTQKWDTNREYRNRRVSYGATRKNNYAFATMPWEPETPEAQPIPIRPDFLIRCK